MLDMLTAPSRRLLAILLATLAAVATTVVASATISPARPAAAGQISTSPAWSKHMMIISNANGPNLCLTPDGAGYINALPCTWQNEQRWDANDSWQFAFGGKTVNRQGHPDMCLGGFIHPWTTTEWLRLKPCVSDYTQDWVFDFEPGTSRVRIINYKSKKAVTIGAMSPSGNGAPLTLMPQREESPAQTFSIDNCYACG
ncbi:hypothetical protein ACTMTJ_42705 [Phytohabitans sp. LJ34]|uniref:hypothetical protein n=1 Tax=Phytohabitans sp. LJ34 TaxID=3452217 RepID=UPI003F8BFF89